MPAILLLVGAIAAFVLAGRMNERLLDLRREHGLDQAEPLENAPPLVAFTTVALGGFRGVLADLLWLRATELQDEGKYFELVQLADWITKLEPRFTSIWAFHAWNLAYNISVLFDDPADRWRWVRHGIRLLRDEGLRYNAGSAPLYRELGWLFQHKVGAAYDQAHLYYKRAWAREMTEALEGPAPNYERLLGPVAGAPEARERLRRLTGLDAAAMRSADEQYGPLDWRLPQAHALYWALQSRKYAKDFDVLAADRMVFQSLADAFREGRLFEDAAEDVFVPSPNLDLLPRVQAAFRQTLEAQPDEPTVNEAYRNFLSQAVVLLYTYHRTRDARTLFEELAGRYPSDDTASGFDAFVVGAFAARVQDAHPNEALAFVEGALYQSLWWFALGDTARGEGFEELAGLCWRTYMEAHADPAARERIGLPPLPQIREQARRRVLEALRSPAARSRVAPPRQ